MTSHLLYDKIKEITGVDKVFHKHFLEKLTRGRYGMTNFDYLEKEPKFKRFVDIAIKAEKIFRIDLEACAMNCRRSMESAIKWLYSVDDALVMPYQDNLYSLMSTEEFHDLIDHDLRRRLDLIRTVGNRAAHNGRRITEDEVGLCLQNLFLFFDYLLYCYGDFYEEKTYDPDLLKQEQEIIQKEVLPDVDLKALIAENKALKEELTAKREEKIQTYVPKPLDLSEYKTRKIYIDSLLSDAGWTEGKDWINEVTLQGMPTDSGKGRADYVLYDDSHKPLAVVEAKESCADVAKGRQQAKLYADILEREYHRRPVVFLTNGFETRIIDNQYPERKVAMIYSKRDLEKLFNLYRMRTGLSHMSVDKQIAGRYYQEAAVRAVCDSFDQRNRRKALLVMATGSGKTRTVIALCKVLLDAGWIKNILFLADRNSLVTQAKRSFVNHLSNLSCANLVEEDDYTAHCIFSTYQTMMNRIDSASDEHGSIFSCGHFDLVICDEAHRSIYNKYRDIFNYFDAPLVGLTATPKDEIDKNTYSIFELENRVPTYGYELAQAVKDEYLVDYLSIETKTKFIDEGITYEELSEEEKETYEKTFETEDGSVPERIESSALNTWIFNADTIKKVLHILMRDGLKVDYGQKIGKTIIFAKNHHHAEKILEIFNQEYPELNQPGKPFAVVIDNYIRNAQSAIDEFSDPKKMPQIAISVDMMDTGIDVPEILNLVFFKKVMSKAKFWQMIGRGTRLCENLIDGNDKDKFYIFDFCSNFEFFRMNKGSASKNQMALQGAIFSMEFEMAYKLQNAEYQQERLKTYRKQLIETMLGKVRELKRDKFDVRQHLKYVDMYSTETGYQTITYEDTLIVREELSPLILPDPDDVMAVRFDALIYGMELALLAGKKFGRYKSDLFKKVSGLAGVSNIPEVGAESELIQKILNTDYVEHAGIDDFEHIRKSLRGLMNIISGEAHCKYDTDFTDQILSMERREAELENDELKNYKAKAEYYIRKHQDNIVIAKLKSNQPLTSMDLESLEQILWDEVGTKEDYEKEYGDKPLGEFVREIVGMDMKAAKEAFSMFLDDVNLDSRQIYFVNQIVEYIVRNGVMKDLSVLQESPFTDQGSVVEIFQDLNVWGNIRSVIDQINANAAIS